MAELLLRVVDKPLSGDLSLDVQRTMRGDVITVQEDGWSWSDKELNNLDWRIIAIPLVPASEFNGMMEPEIGDPKINPYLQRRAMKYALDSLAGALATAINKVPGNVILPANKTAFDAIRFTRPPIDDPAAL